LKVGNPFGMSSTELLLAIDILEGFMINDKNELLLHQAMTPMLQRLDNGVELQIIGKIVLIGPRQLLPETDNGGINYRTNFFL
jgi:hypothetical protein